MKIAVILVLMIAGVAAGVIFAGGLMSGSPKRTGPERLIELNSSRPSGSLYHVADVQSRPAVAAVLKRYQAAGLCEFIFKFRTHKMHDNMTFAKTCAESLAGEHSWWHDHALAFDASELAGQNTHTTFALFIDEQQVPYLFAEGKNGSVTADQLETLVVTVLDKVIAEAPSVAAKASASKAASEKARLEDEAKRRRAAESFKVAKWVSTGST